MAIHLRDVLLHPCLAPAAPVLLTGGEHRTRAVRWVHSSEVIDLAHLLRGGELLLTGGLMLAEAAPERQRRYIRDLAARGVAAVAVETGTVMPRLPDALVEEAQRRDFPLIQLRRTAPFVEVAETINSLLINESVHRLRLADALSDRLSARLTSGGDLQTLVETLAEAVNADVGVRDGAGEPLAAATAPGDPSARRSADTVEAPITAYGVVVARLLLTPIADGDPALLDAALDRAPQSFGLALLRTRPVTPGSRATRTLFHALRRSAPPPAPLAPLAAAAGLPTPGLFVAVVARQARGGGRLGPLEHAMRLRGRRVLSHIEDDELLAIAALPPQRPGDARRALVEDLRDSPGAEMRPVGIGPLVRGAERLPYTVLEAHRCLDLTDAVGVTDSGTCALERLVHRLDADEFLRDFVDEQLGGLFDQDPEVSRRLLHTLEVFFDCSANKTETARRLHLHRQTLYQRLDRLTHSLGRDVTDPAALPGLQVAVRLLRAGRTIDGPHERGEA
ncbi:purine catabolism regulator [Spinactinospora alkalitolerans]|uniref:Purine catabolism regulator n=1 Tax=Spinactinospora alkalitolerans TaxID=687207 RepID=A0A852TVT0_9ACTN|nr:PucR family transcriptional regulator ligand-binding domain-containing protein [Spinactinospora alkalitolerans]NYE48038.1 purine catabolism regulator [Spinactinospora alkalitolerans]